MAKIEDLPTEILRDILYRLRCEYQPPQSLSTSPAVDAMFPRRVLLESDPDDIGNDPNRQLINACLVSRRFRDVAQPILFQDFRDDSVDGNLEATISLAKTLYSRPELAQHVHSVAIVPTLFEEGNPDPISPADGEVFEKAIKELGLPKDKEAASLRAMRARNVSCLTALVLNQVPQLRSLHIQGGVLMAALEPVIERNPSPLSGLEFLWIEGTEEEVYTIGDFEALVPLPNLRFATFNNGDLFKNSYPSSWGPDTLAIEDVAFHQCVVDAVSLRKFMKACKKLKSFTYNNFNFTRGARFPGRHVKSEITAVQAQEIARAHSETLEHFQVSFVRDPMDPREIQTYNRKCPKIASFRDFPALTSIYLPHAFLPPHPQFSPSLEYLQITDCNVSIRDMMAKIATDVKKGRYPKLKGIEVQSFDISRPIKLTGQIVPAGKTPQQCFMELQGLFEGTGVDFNICPYHSDRPNHPDIDYDDIDDPFFPMGGPPGGGMPDEMLDGMPPELLEMFMRQALQDPDLAHLVRGAGRR